MTDDGDADSIPELCRPFLGSLPVAGAAVTVIAGSGGHLSLCSSDETAARLDELQFADDVVSRRLDPARLVIE